MELASALFIGCLLAVQASANLQLTRGLGTPYGAAAVQLGLATLVLLVAAVATGSLPAAGPVTWWHLLGGLASPLYITSGILLFPRLGALTSVALFVTGQMFASLALDLAGLLGVSRRPLTGAVAVGSVAVLAGITAIVRAQRPAPASAGPVPGPAAGRIGWLGLGLVAGAVLPIQGAVNARLRADLHEPLAVALVSFVIATIAILVVVVATRTRFRPDLGVVPWWGWLGCLCAATYVTGTFLLLPTLGAATTIALTVTGQQLASALIDHVGGFRLARRPLTAARSGGLALLLLGCLLVQLG
ncbi:DMT family transporter [Cryptosporangium arvum]|uniref:DMT family transporter n=1 Tax=Cryptosporangium arvum TaxID=80871 RepID=UPI0004AF5DAC|nr:DMT family transporter [Cryptosporangium arvum]